MKYEKPEVVAQNSNSGSFSAGCPEKGNSPSYTCRDCERTS